MSNLPDDWGAYHRSCGLCGSRYHASGVDECRCVQCIGCEQQKPPSEMEAEGVCAQCFEVGMNMEYGVWIEIMEDVRLSLGQGVPVINCNGTNYQGVCVKNTWEETVDIVQDGELNRTLARYVPVDGTDTTYRVDLTEPGGMAWALMHGIREEVVSQSDDMWHAVMDRHWARETTDDDREQLALALSSVVGVRR